MASHMECFTNPGFQLDVVFPADDASAAALEGVLSQLTTKYHRARVGLAEFATGAESHVQRYALESDLVAIGFSSKESLSGSDAVWCLDTRGFITIAVDSVTYQRLGMVGQPLPWRAHEDTFIIQISLRPYATSESDKQSHVLPFNAKVKAALKSWDSQRDSDWEVVYNCTTDFAQLDAKAELCAVSPRLRTSNQVHVPEVLLLEFPKTEEVQGEWDEAVSSLLEWAGMACLGSQRLQARDAPDPFVAVYAPPDPSRVADIHHFSWTGLLTPAFVQQVLDSCRSASFVSVCANSVVRSPITYLSPLSPHKSFLRMPREDSEDAWTLLLQRSNDSDHGRWLLAESVGRFDARWG